MCIPAAFLFLLTDKSFLKKIIVLVSISIMSLSLLFGGSRGGVLFLALNLMIAFLFLRVNFKTKVYAVIALAVVAFVVGFFLQEYFFSFFERTFERFSEKGLEDTTRAKNFAASIQILLDHPFGIGVSQINFAPLLMEYANIYFASPHNIYLEMGLQVGINGLIMFLSIVGLTVYYNIYDFQRAEDPILRMALSMSLVFLTGFLLMGFTEPIFRNYYKLNHLFGLILGISLSLHYRIQNDLLSNKYEYLQTI
jgi:O-antigen ligase